mmetsp:Transcript_42479/g.52281  ORF Transcript_42479/g.52281 Transcript_42479/m.52281 type:complete len:89 (+) Transcript_42479:59-325(+)
MWIWQVGTGTNNINLGRDDGHVIWIEVVSDDILVSGFHERFKATEKGKRRYRKLKHKKYHNTDKTKGLFKYFSETLAHQEYQEVYHPR